MELLLKDFSTGYSKYEVINKINFRLKQNEWIGIIGANGSGKSTLLKGVLKFIPTLYGDVLFEDNSIKNYSRNNLSRKIGYLPQKLNNNLNITVKDLISLGRSPYKNFWDFDLNEDDLKIIDEAIQIMDLNELKNKFINELSGGQSQRAFLAMTIAQNTKILLLDEPTTFLDINYQIKFLESLKNLIKIKKLSIITVLHDINLAARFCDRIAILKEGKLIDINIPEKVLNKENFKRGFEIDSHIIETPVGIQIIPVDKKL